MKTFIINVYDNGNYLSIIKINEDGIAKEDKELAWKIWQFVRIEKNKSFTENDIKYALSHFKIYSNYEQIFIVYDAVIVRLR